MHLTCSCWTHSFFSKHVGGSSSSMMSIFAVVTNMWSFMSISAFMIYMWYVCELWSIYCVNWYVSRRDLYVCVNCQIFVVVVCELWYVCRRDMFVVCEFVSFIVICELFVKCRDFIKNRINLSHIATVPCIGTRQRTLPSTGARHRRHAAPTCVPGNLPDDQMVNVPCVFAKGARQRVRTWPLARRPGGRYAVHVSRRRTAKICAVPWGWRGGARQIFKMCRVCAVRHTAKI